MYPGSEPGIDPRRVTANLTYGQFKRACHIEIAEYDANNASLRHLTNDELVRLMETDQESPKPASNDSSSSTVRWINIGGLDWDVISAVALRYNLHVLALEDVLHEQGHIQSKADYFYEHLFIRILCHRLDRDKDEAGQHNEGSHIPDPRTEFPETWLEDGRLAFRQIQATKSRPTPVSPPCDSNPPAKRHTMSKGLTGFIGTARRRQILRINALTRGDRVTVRHEPMSIFLTRHGTVITIHPKPSLDYTAPIRERILQPESVLRTSEDASLLVEALLDLVVDKTLEIMDEYQDKLHQVEHDVLLKPGLDTLRSLHILSGDLIMHKRTLDPIKSLIHGLRHNDRDRWNALPKQAGTDGLAHSSREQRQGYLSYQAKLYLSDVSDHIDFVLTSLDMFAGLAENLINFAFNTASYQMNQVMRRLTLATIIFLPLTLLTGYFGMNFTSFGAINGSVSLFWSIALPVMAALIPVFMLTDIRRMVQTLQKRMAANQISKMVSM